jgi:cyclophilin family peptidyl-prolyl cis-trans isomerase
MKHAPIVWIIAIIGIFILAVLWFQGQSAPVQSDLPTQTQNTMPEHTSYAKITTNKGVITVGFYGSEAPKTVENFTTLTNKKFYDGIIFHRVIPNFMIQGGDPSGNGTGGPGYKFADEINPTSALYQNGYKRGVMAMANAGPNTNGSQFFIMHADYPLPPSYTIFGSVVSGQEVVDAIASVKTGPQDRPVEPVTMTRVEMVPRP